MDSKALKFAADLIEFAAYAGAFQSLTPEDRVRAAELVKTLRADSPKTEG